jgi:8-amino-7-oxononanoate synthase
MLTKQEDFLQSFLDRRQSDLSIRQLTVKDHLTDFCSNDYLGFSRSALLRHRVEEEMKRHPFHAQGSTGSRLITGNNEYIIALEKSISQFHNAENCLIFNSGYDANLGLFASVPQKGDLVIFDEMVHASIRDGIKVCRAEAVSFRHNDIEDLHSKLKMSEQNAFVSIETVYSMDGDEAPLAEIVSLCKMYGARLIVDEAHATGLYGEKGEGLTQSLGLEKDVFAKVHTFSKALGCHGAAVLGSDVLKQFLVNFSRSFIFTTALTFHSLVSVKCAYDILAKQQIKRNKISLLVSLFKLNIQDNPAIQVSGGNGPIQSIIIPGNDRAKQVSAALEQAGFYAKAILYPTVPRGSERIRICIHSFNAEAQVISLANKLNELLK